MKTQEFKLDVSVWNNRTLKTELHQFTANEIQKDLGSDFLKKYTVAQLKEIYQYSDLYN